MADIRDFFFIYLSVLTVIGYLNIHGHSLKSLNAHLKLIFKNTDLITQFNEINIHTAHYNVVMLCSI